MDITIFNKGDKVLYNNETYVVTRVWNHNHTNHMVYYDLEQETGIMLSDGFGSIGSEEYKQKHLSVHCLEIKEIKPETRIVLFEKNYELFLWGIIEKANWVSDHKYARIGNEFVILPLEVKRRLYDFIRYKHKDLSERYTGKWLSQPGYKFSDDGWSDLLAEVVGRGRGFYDSISFEKLKEMADNDDYVESFLYTIF